MDEIYPVIPNAPRKINVIDTEEKVGYAVEHLLKYDLLGFDLETYHKFDKRIEAFNPCDGARMRLAQFTTPKGNTFVFDLYKVSSDFLYYMFPNRYLCVIQNAKFELKYLMFEKGIYDFGPIWDTMIAEQITSRGRVAGEDHIPVGLDRIAKRRLDVYLPKDEQAGDWYKTELSERQIRYAATDSTVVLPIYQSQRQSLKEQGQVRVAELEFDCTPALAWMENTGFTMDAPTWTGVCDKMAQEIKGIKHELWGLLGQQGSLFADAEIAPINLESGPQVMQAFERLGLTIPINPKTGEPTLSNKLMAQIEGRRDVELYIKYVKLAKRLSSFGYNWVDKINPYSGRIHCSLKQIGAETGRMSCYAPNLMQIPKENLYRNCFRAQDGWVLVDNDYSQCELRILAEYCRDPNLLLAFDKGYDLHRFSASLIFKKTMDEVTDKERGIAKNLNFGIVYGIGSAKFASDAHIGTEHAQEIMDYYLKKAYPEMGNWLEGRARAILYHLQGDTMTGRLRQYSGDIRDKEFKAQVQRHGKNLPIQGTNADVTKLALAQTYKAIVKNKWVNDMHLILPVHDEIVGEARPTYVEDMNELMTREMLSAERQYLRRVPSVVDGSITVRWAKELTDELSQEAVKLMEEK